MRPNPSSKPPTSAHLLLPGRQPDHFHLYLNKTGEPESSRGRHLASGSSPSPAGKIFCVKAASAMLWARAIALDSASSQSLILHPHTHTHPHPSMTPWGSPKPAHKPQSPQKRTTFPLLLVWRGVRTQPHPRPEAPAWAHPSQVCISQDSCGLLPAGAPPPARPPRMPRTPRMQPDLSDSSHPKVMSLVKHLRNHGALGGLQSN